MKINCLFFILCITIYSNFTYSKETAKESKNQLDNLTLSITYPEKMSYFHYKKNLKNEIHLFVDGHKKGERKLSVKDANWLEKKISSFSFESRSLSSKCQIGEIALFVNHRSREKSLRRCIGAKDKTTEDLLKLAQTLRIFL